MSLKQKLKSFFKAGESSDYAVELLRMFILPFARKYKGRGNTVDDVLSAFFALEARRFVMVRAKEKFRLPGKYYLAGNRPVYGLGPRNIIKGQKILMAMDRKDSTARLETMIDNHYHCFLLESFELKTIEDKLEPFKA